MSQPELFRSSFFPCFSSSCALSVWDTFTSLFVARCYCDSSFAWAKLSASTALCASLFLHVLSSAQIFLNSVLFCCARRCLCNLLCFSSCFHSFHSVRFALRHCFSFAVSSEREVFPSTNHSERFFPFPVSTSNCTSSFYRFQESFRIHPPYVLQRTALTALYCTGLHSLSQFSFGSKLLLPLLSALDSYLSSINSSQSHHNIHALIRLTSFIQSSSLIHFL